MIGSKARKAAYIRRGAVQLVMELLEGALKGLRKSPGNGLDRDTVIQATATLGSFSCVMGVEEFEEFTRALDPVALLVQTLEVDDPKVVDTGVRSLKMVFQARAPEVDSIVQSGAVGRLIALLRDRENLTADVAATVLARCCRTTEQQEAIAEAGGIGGLAALLHSSLHFVQEAGLDALNYLTLGNKKLSGAVYWSAGTIGTMYQLTKSPLPRTRLLAATCITNISTEYASGPEGLELRRQVLPVVVKLLGNEKYREEVPHVLARLVGAEEELQKSACEADAVKRLTAYLHGDGGASARQKEGVLLCLGALCEHREESRKELFDSKGLNPIVEALGDDVPAVRSAACVCVRSLSRSVKALRTSLAEANIVAPLFRLLSDPCTGVKAHASATICNMVLDFSPVKQQILEVGGIQQIADLAHSMDMTLRLNALWALRNLVYCAKSELKQKVVQELSWPSLMTYLGDADEDIQIHAVGIIRNLAHGTPADVDLILRNEGGAVLRALGEKLAEPSARKAAIKVETLYAIVNMATGTDAHKDLIMESGVMQSVFHHLSDQDTEVRVAAVWILINLCWLEDPVKTKPVQARMRRLAELGFVRKLRLMTSDPYLDVKDRVSTALAFFTEDSLRAEVSL